MIIEVTTNIRVGEGVIEVITNVRIHDDHRGDH